MNPTVPLLFASLSFFPPLLTAQQAADAAARAADARALAATLDRFGAGLVAATGDPGRNHCLAPASVSLTLLMVLAGAGGETAAELRRALAPQGLDDARVHGAARHLLQSLREPGEDVQLAVADDLWLQRGQPLREGYLQTMQAAYGAVPQTLDFRGDVEAARRTINAHVANVTQSRIAELLPRGGLDAGTLLVLTNAVWLKAAWEHPFAPHGTRDQPFTLADGSTASVPTMMLHAELPYRDAGEARIVRLHYRGRAFAMDIALPQPGKPLDAARDALAALGDGSGAAAPAAADVVLLLPRFRVASAVQLRGPLERLGLRTMFTPDADFTPADGGAGALRVQQVFHQTFLEVGEKGTEAAAATASLAPGAAVAPVRQEPVRFLVDRPFCYRLVDLRTGLVLFAGHVADPRG